MKTALLVAFQPFGRYVVNATEQLVRQLNGQVIEGHQIRSLVFPVDIFPAHDNYGLRVITAAQQHSADVIVSLGMASEILGIRIESQAVNWVENEKYCRPEENKRRLDESLPATAIKVINLSRWNLEKLRRDMRTRGIPCEKEISTDAGRYCCNALIFRALQAIEHQQHSLPFLFLHVSCTARAVKEIPEFKRYVISEYQLEQTVQIALSCYH